MLRADEAPMSLAHTERQLSINSTPTPTVKTEEFSEEAARGRFRSAKEAEENRSKTLERPEQDKRSVNPETVVSLTMVFGGAIAQAVEMYKPRPNPQEIRAALDATKRSLPRGARGRPTDPLVTRAVELRLQGCTWLDVYKEAIADFATLEPARKTLEAIKLRQAVNRRIKSNNDKTLVGLSA